MAELAQEALGPPLGAIPVPGSRSGDLVAEASEMHAVAAREMPEDAPRSRPISGRNGSWDARAQEEEVEHGPSSTIVPASGFRRTETPPGALRGSLGAATASLFFHRPEPNG
jgi:hypothetical protein